MYTLYHSREEKKIEVRKARKVQNFNYQDHVTSHNDCYYICLKRAPLLEKARQMKSEWIAELEE